MTSRVKSPWQSSCVVCAAPITNYGSGKPKTLCSTACKKARHRQTSKLRYETVIKPARQATPKVIPVRAPSKQLQTTLRQKNIVAAEKLRRGKCAYHLHYFGSDLYVSHDLMQAFEFDHIDRIDKHQPSKKRGGGVARMVGRVTDEQLIAEMSKCELVCCNCHRLKTIASRDWSANKNSVEQSQLELQLK
jgi:hypothetical protein